MNNKYRAQILLEPEQHAALVEIAQQEGRSISEVVREIVQCYLSQQEGTSLWRQRTQALERLKQIREGVEQRYGVYSGDLLEEINQQQDEDTLRIWRGET